MENTYKQAVTAPKCRVLVFGESEYTILVGGKKDQEPQFGWLKSALSPHTL